MKASTQRVTNAVSAFIVTGVSLWGLYQIYQFYLNKRQRRLQLHALKEYRQDKKVSVIITGSQWEKFYDALSKEDLKVIGIDCEWMNRTSKVSLLQVATLGGSCALVRLFCLDYIPDSLRMIMKDKSILKVGVASVEDGRKLFRDYGFLVYGCVDLRHILKRVRGIFKCQRIGLQGLASGVLGIHLDKNPKIRMGNWEAEHLSMEQVEYAALDALVGLDIFVTMVIAKLINRNPQVTASIVTDYTAKEEFWVTSRSLCQGVVDVQYKNSGSKMEPKPQSDVHVPAGVAKLTQAWKEALENDQNDAIEILKKTKESRAYVVRQRPLYYNCSLLAPDGQMLCTCDVRKVEWYISKGLADKVSDDPLTVKLRFEPAGRPETDDDYYLQEKENICVVCGSEERLIRKQVIPKEYRRFFPSSLKDHASHDVLLMCVPCHQTSTQYDTVLRFQLAEECNAPIDMGSSVRVQTDHDLMKIRSAARALMNTKVSIPGSRKEELRKVLLDFYGVQEITQDLLEEASEMDFKTINEDYLPHGKKVIRHMRKNGGLYNFERRWRQHFLDTMKPKFLPPMWSVDHKHERTHLYS